MRIVVVGNSGAGKTSARLILRSMLPQYKVVIITYEGDVFMQEPFGDMLPTSLSVDELPEVLRECDSVIISMGRFFDNDVCNQLKYDVALHIQCDENLRLERIEARGNRRLTDQDKAFVTTLNGTYPTTLTPIDNNGTREQLSAQLEQFVHQHQLRPLTMPQE